MNYFNRKETIFHKFQTIESPFDQSYSLEISFV